jgi:hypothetical protein
MKLHSAYMPHSQQKIYYDETGHMVCGWDVVQQSAWIMTGDPLPPAGVIQFVLNDNRSRVIQLELPLAAYPSLIRNSIH